MTIMTPTLEAGSPRPSAILDRLYRDEPVYAGLTILLLAAAPAMLVAAAIDGRNFGGDDIWAKPLKFDLALVVYLGTLAVFARWVPEASRASRPYRLFRAAVALAVIAEMLWIGGAAMLGTASHFNTSPVGAVIYPAMGVAAILITSATTVQAWQIARSTDTGLPAPVRTSIVLGLALVLPLTLLTAGTMASMPGHTIGATGLDANGAFLFGWSREAGDLRVAHFFATHALHVVPILGTLAWLVAPRMAATLVWFVAVAYAGFVVAVFAQAIAGLPFLPGLL